MKTKRLITGLSLLSYLYISALSCVSRSGLSEKIPSDTGWVSLFNGKDLSGWAELEGKAKFEAEDGQIIGITSPHNPNSMLCTNESYDNFILELDVKVDSPLNSGIQVRSHLNDKDEVYGLQIEVDPSSRAWSGGIYDNNRRGWLVNLKDKPEKQKTFKNREWNHYRIRFNEDTLSSWINEVPIATLVDTLNAPRGFIALQMDNNEREGLQVRFKNIRIKFIK